MSLCFSRRTGIFYFDLHTTFYTVIITTYLVLLRMQCLAFQFFQCAFGRAEDDDQCEHMYLWSAFGKNVLSVFKHSDIACSTSSSSSRLYCLKGVDTRCRRSTDLQSFYPVYQDISFRYKRPLIKIYYPFIYACLLPTYAVWLLSARTITKDHPNPKTENSSSHAMQHICYTQVYK